MVLFQSIEFNTVKCKNSFISKNSVQQKNTIWMSNSSIWSIDRTLSGAATQSQSGPRSDDNEWVLCIPQSSSIIGASPSDFLMSYLGHSLSGGVLPLFRDAVCVFYSPSWHFTRDVHNDQTKYIYHHHHHHHQIILITHYSLTLSLLFSMPILHHSWIYEALCFDVAQGRLNGAPNETRTHSCRFATQDC